MNGNNLYIVTTKYLCGIYNADFIALSFTQSTVFCPCHNPNLTYVLYTHFATSYVHKIRLPVKPDLS